MRKLSGSGVMVLIGLGQSVSGLQNPVIGVVLMGAGLLLGLFFVLSHDRTRGLLDGLSWKVPGVAGPPIGDGHLGELRATLGEVARAVEGGEVCRYGDATGSTLNRDALYAHSNGLVAGLAEWDQVVTRLGAAVTALLAHLHEDANAQGVVEPTFFPNRIIEKLHPQIVERARDGLLDQRLSLQWGTVRDLGVIFPGALTADPWVELEPEPGEAPESWMAKAHDLRGRVDGFFREAQESPEAREVADAHAALEGLKPSMLEQLRLGGKREVYGAVADCPVCKINQP